MEERKGPAANSVITRMHTSNIDPRKDTVGKNMEHLYAANSKWAEDMKQRDPVVLRA